VSLPSDRSFLTYEDARAHFLEPPLSDDLDLYWNQQLLDVLIVYPIRSDRSAFAIHPEIDRFGDNVSMALRFMPPDEPLVFTKFPSCITGGVTQVELPPGNVDWEIEVVAVIGKGGYRIDRAHAWDAVAGLTLGQDLSERILQLTGTPPQCSLAKSHPGFGPIGPVAVTPDEFSNRDDLGFESFLDGEPLQHGRTSDMIFPIDDLVARLSAACRLLPGDLIFTGTPAGVGHGMKPPTYLHPGEVLRTTIEGLGELVNRCVPEVG
jgi:2-keto-4-pentenoate hydratase/2-oxohepta-3-ene-1,7-dioic acid hydratase in catechol pathway